VGFDPAKCATISVPEAGRAFFGLSRDGSYDAARRGEIPTIKVGRKLRVPIAVMEEILARAGKCRGPEYQT
jgi:hypothetical protein